MECFAVDRCEAGTASSAERGRSVIFLFLHNKYDHEYHDADCCRDDDQDPPQAVFRKAADGAHAFVVEGVYSVFPFGAAGAGNPVFND